LKKRRLSSVKRRFEIPGAPRATVKGVMVPLLVSPFRIQERASPTNKNRYGLRGSPCLMPLEGEKACVVCPLILTENRTEVTQLITQLVHLLQKPSFRSIFSRKRQSTRSYAFERSSLYAQWVSLWFLLLWILWKHSKAIAAL
jgi:hypothetical protein